MEPHWTTKAACKGSPTNWFVASRVGEPEVRHLKHHQMKTYNFKKFDRAKKVCQGCPVRDQCFSDSSPADRFWSVRGGEYPTCYRTGRFDGSKGGVPSFPSADYAEYRCTKGHLGDEYIGYKLNAKSGNLTKYCLKCVHDVQ